MCSIQLIDRMSRNNDLIDNKENRLQEAINYYHQHKGEKGYSIRFVADYFGVCDTTLLRRLAKKTQWRFQDNKNLFDKDMRQKWVEVMKEREGAKKPRSKNVANRLISSAMGIMTEASIIEMLRGDEIEKENKRIMKAEELENRNKRKAERDLRMQENLETKKAAKDEAVKKKEEDTKKKREEQEANKLEADKKKEEKKL